MAETDPPKLFDWQPPDESGERRVPYLDKVSSTFSTPETQALKPYWNHFRDNLSIFWMSVFTNLGHHDGDGSITGSLISAAESISVIQPERLILPHQIPLQQLSLSRRISFSAHEDRATITLLDNSAVDISKAEATRLAELNEYQFLFLQHALTSGLIHPELIEQISMLQNICSAAESDQDPGWLYTGYRGLLLSIYPEAREELVEERNSFDYKEKHAIDQGLTLEEKRRVGSRSMNYEKSERARAIAGHFSKLIHKIVILNAGTKGSTLPGSLSIFVQVAEELSSLSAATISRELNLHTGYFRSVVDVTGEYIVDWFIGCRFEELYDFVPFNSGDTDRMKEARRAYLEQQAAASQELLEYAVEVTGIDLGKIAGFFDMEEALSGIQSLDYGDDPSAALAKLTIIRQQLQSWLHENRSHNLITTSLYIISLAKLLQTDILRGTPGKVLPPLAIPTANGGKVFPDGVVVNSDNHSSPDALWKELAESGEPTMLIEVKAYSRLNPPANALKKDIIQTVNYVDSLAALGVNVERVLFAYVTPTILKLIPVSTEELRAMYTSYQL